MKNDEKQSLLQRKCLLFFAKFLLAGIFLLFQLSALAQERTVSGTVTGVSNEPLAGVTVVVKGTTAGTLTDPNGKFTLSVPASGRILAFSFVGMETKEIEIGAGNVYNVVLGEKVLNLEEVVVVGYGTQKKISITGAIVSVQSTDLVKSPNAAISNTLAGRVTGLTTVQYSGRPGGDDPNIYVRGIGSLTESASAPLMLVDGVERSFTQIDPNEIESVSVLKDASATAVYGIRGANGVIIVTTKRGIEGAPRISFTSSAGLQVPTRLVDMADSYQYALVHNAATLSDNASAVVKFSPAAIKAFKAGRDGTATLAQSLIYPNTDWTDMLVKPYAFQTQENININGGSSIVKYFVSLGYLNQDGLFNTFQTDYSYNYGFQRYNYRANIDLEATKSTTFSLTIGGRSELRQEPATQPSEGVFTVLYWAVPYSGKMYEGNRVLLGNKYIGGTEKKDGLNAIGWGTGYTRALSNIMNLDIEVAQKLDFVTKGLKWTVKASNNSTAGHSKTRSTSKATYDPYYLCDVSTAVGDSTVVFKKSGSDGLLGYSESSSKSRNWYLETALRYGRDFGSHSITGLLLYNESKRFYPGGTYNDIPTGYVGIAARATYNYKLKYLVDLNLGYNGSENFAPGKRFGFFPAIAIGWTLTEENFMKGRIPFLDFLKFRFSYGIVGNDIFGSNRFLYIPNSYNANAGGYSFGTSTTLLQYFATEGAIGNPDVTWERAKKQNYGIDLKLFKGKLGLTADYFYEFRNNILTSRNTVPSILNISLPSMNIGRTQNQGYEVELRWRDNIGKVNYYITTNMSFARNKILYMDEIPKNYDYLVQTGRPVNQRFTYIFDAFWSADEIAHLSDFPDAGYLPKPGDVRYKDLNDDKKIDADDQMAYGYPDYPEYNFSLQGGVDYKGFDFSMLWNGVTNASRMMNDTWRIAFADLGDRSLLKWLADNSWTPETAATAKAPRISFSGRINNTKSSSLWLKDASYLRLKNIEIGYSFSVLALKRLGISRMRVSMSGYDLITFDKIKFLDPESRTSSPDYPLIKIYNLGLNVTF